MNHDYLSQLAEQDIQIEVVSDTEAEMYEMWSFVHNKSQKYWLWWAIDHKIGTPLAFCFGTKFKLFDKKGKKLLDKVGEHNYNSLCRSRKASGT
ncbi:MAG: IS1 family transposase [Defluviitaleaceae bacterium]|nr:IS1 family transposase [Defluviitaleaceae bacterium]